jgi:hypothetical protein
VDLLTLKGEQSMQTFWKKTCRELYRRTTLTASQAREMTDEELEDTMWEAARPWEEQWEALNVNESKVEEQEIDDDDRQARFWRRRPDGFAVNEKEHDHSTRLTRRSWWQGIPDTVFFECLIGRLGSRLKSIILNRKVICAEDGHARVGLTWISISLDCFRLVFVRAFCLVNGQAKVVCTISHAPFQWRCPHERYMKRHLVYTEDKDNKIYRGARTALIIRSSHVRQHMYNESIKENLTHGSFSLRRVRPVIFVSVNRDA